MLERLFNPSRIAVFELFGAIGSPSRTAEYVRSLYSLADNSTVRAVILDIDSPGGSAAASDYLYSSVKKLAEKKPVVAFIRGAGASGAYMVSCAATTIVALPTAIVGSIGAISARPLLYELLHRLGIKVSITKSGRLKDMWSPLREPTKEEREKEQALLDEIYAHFIDAVAKGRDMSEEHVRRLATGEVFTATKAKELGLVDALGDLDTAIEAAMELGGVPRRITYVRPRRGLRALLMSRLMNSFVEELSAQLDHSLRGRIDYSRFS
jgi:protease-4